MNILFNNNATRKKLLAGLLMLTSLTSVATEYKSKTATDKNGFVYEYVENDPLNVHIYTLKNGLKVYLSKNEDKPRIQTYISVKAGSSYDPKETTGLAHYLEHLMFKGNSQIGALDWANEQPLLDTIAELYEQHKARTDANEKKLIYRKIDSVSQIAAKYVATNELDHLYRSIGADKTNAYTSNEQTVYVNDIPANTVKKWIELEETRFSEFTPRLFHTELEAVYEEFNMSQDNDGRQIWYSLLKNIFPTHPYGQQTTIGNAQHLKNPSIRNIHEYWNKYYVPNNMAICMMGDLDYEQTIAIIDSTWSKIPARNVPEIILPKEQPLTTDIIDTVWGPSQESMYMAFRSNGVKSEDVKYIKIIDFILANGTAGLLDIDLNNQQKVMFAACFPEFFNDYGLHCFIGRPRENQSLAEVEQLILQEIEKIKHGEFDEWMIQASVNNMKLENMREQEANTYAEYFSDCFIHNLDWNEFLSQYDEMAKITKKDIVDFANKFYQHHVSIYKMIGNDNKKVKVEKPEITPVPINRESHSEFYNKYIAESVNKIEPVFVDYDKTIKRSKINKNTDFSYVKNTNNDLFSLYYIVEMGSKHNKLLPLAVNYLEYLGTKKYSAAELNCEYYRYALHFGVNASDEETYIYINGLESSFDKGLQLLEHVVANTMPNVETYNNYVDDIIKARNDAKINQKAIQSALMSYGKYGENSPFRDIISEQELRNINPTDLTEIIKDLLHYKHQIFYYGTQDFATVESKLNKNHKPKINKTVPEAKKYEVIETPRDKVYFVNYDMVQAGIYTLARAKKFDSNEIGYFDVFNEYYGTGMSSIVFQEIRESQALAYQAYAKYSTASKQNDYDMIMTGTLTGTDKIEQSTTAMKDLMTNMRQVDYMFNDSKEAVLNRIATNRITKTNIFFSYLANKHRGIDYDYREKEYEQIKNMTIDDFAKFFDENIANNNYIYLIMSNKKDIDFDVLNKLGETKEISLEELFNY